ncbi:ATP-binding protein [Kineococcus terrestris]|uniref:ATP-binding protein n=1 Tax=Kineococcus terrestris TaxID=2044856 RepID=UPI0034DB0DEC
MSVEEAAGPATVGVEELRTLFLFEHLDEEDVRWLAGRGDRRTYPAGATVFATGEPAGHLWVLLEGEVRQEKQVGGRPVVLGTTSQRGAYAGAVRAFVDEGQQVYANTLSTTTTTSLFRLPARDFAAFVRTRMPMAVHLLDGLYVGLRNTEATVRQQEHLARLGHLSAGLAHELNNPAAAAVRAASQFGRVLGVLADPPPVVDGLAGAAAEVLAAARERARDGGGVALGALERADAEDEVADVLEDAGVAEAQEAAVVLVAAGLGADEVAAAVERLRGPGLSERVGWLAAVLEADALAREIGTATQAISALVAAVKAYSYLDSGSAQDVDVHAGLDSTLTMLGHKLRDVRVVREYADGLPRVSAHGAELNQVWTNLLDNAVHAVGGRGTVVLRTRATGDGVRVEVADDGPGVDEAVRDRLFDAFVTTKGPGGGTGLGLDACRRIVEDRHHGRISFTTGPGGTTFAVDLPVVRPR